MTSAPLSHPGNLLVVDDDPTIIALLQQTLRAQGYRVLATTCVAEALAMLRGVRVQLILTDAFRTPGEPDPWSSLARLRERARGTPLVICSALPGSSFASFAERGFAGLVAKPFDLDTLTTVIRQTIDRDRFLHPGRRAAQAAWT